MKTYPVNLVGLERERCIVIGGSKVAERKVAGLVDAGARPLVISPTLTPGLADLLAAGNIKHRQRKHRPDDLEGAFLVIAATGDPKLNHQVWETARKKGALVNVVDAPQLCNFYTPSVVRRGDFVVSVSTGGAVPVLAARTRREMETRFGREYDVLTAWCAAIRPVMREAFPDPAERRACWYALVDSPVLSLLSAGRYTEAHAWIEENLGARLADLIPSEPRRQSCEQ